MSPFHNRLNELRLLTPLVGKTMLELGNKKNKDITYKSYFERLGFVHTSVDWNGLDGALKLDLTKPLNLGTFDMVTNVGTTEHVHDQAAVWRNVLEAMHVGSVLVSVTPLPGDWTWHGNWYPSIHFFHRLARMNGLYIERFYVDGVEPRRLIYVRAALRYLAPFDMPVGNMHYNEIK